MMRMLWRRRRRRLLPVENRIKVYEWESSGDGREGQWLKGFFPHYEKCTRSKTHLSPIYLERPCFLLIGRRWFSFLIKKMLLPLLWEGKLKLKRAKAARQKERKKEWKVSFIIDITTDEWRIYWRRAARALVASASVSVAGFRAHSERPTKLDEGEWEIFGVCPTRPTTVIHHEHWMSRSKVWYRRRHCRHISDGVLGGCLCTSPMDRAKCIHSAHNIKLYFKQKWISPSLSSLCCALFALAWVRL